MKISTFSLILLLSASSCSHKTESNVTDIPQAKAAAQKSAEQWLALVDVGNYAESWKTASAYFQSAVPQNQWEHTIAAVRGPLGDMVSRQLKSAQYTKSLPDALAGQYVVLQFDTSFANKKEAVETVTPRLDPDGQWKVSGYYIK
jgi:hypothetical protein